MKFKPEEFNRKRPPQEIIECLDLWRSKIENYKMQILKDNRVLTAESLRSVVQSGGIKSYSIKDLFEDYLHILSKRVGVDLKQSVYRKYELIYEKFQEFISKDEDVTKITPQLIKIVEVTWRGRMDASTLAGYLTRLKTFIKFGVDNGHLTINPFQIKITKPSKPIKALNEDEVNHLLTLSLEPRLQRVLDTFLVQVGTGMSYSDLLNFSINDLKKEGDWYYISKNRVKTGKVFTALVLPFAADIILKYRTLPIISNQVYNRYLKEINSSLTSHMGRRTYATMLINRHLSMEVVSAALGDTPQVAARYYAKLFEKTLIQEQINALKK